MDSNARISSATPGSASEAFMSETTAGDLGKRCWSMDRAYILAERTTGWFAGNSAPLEGAGAEVTVDATSNLLSLSTTDPGSAMPQRIGAGQQQRVERIERRHFPGDRPNREQRDCHWIKAERARPP